MENLTAKSEAPKREAAGVECDQCGEIVARLYQRDLCKSCLEDGLRLSIGLINYYRVSRKDYRRS